MTRADLAPGAEGLGGQLRALGGRSRRWSSAGGRLATWASWLLPFLVAIAVYSVAYSTMVIGPTGDEPDYFLISASIVDDGDIDVRNQYADRELVHTACPACPFPAGPPAFDYTGDGRLTSFHYIGLPLLLAPAVATARSELAVRAELIVIAALAALVLLAILRRISSGPAALVYLVWAAVAFSLPLVTYSNQLYPELPGALFVLLAVLALVATPRTRWLVLGACAAAYLPWLHVRYTPLAITLIALLAYRGARAAWGEGGTDRARRALRRSALAVLPGVVSYALLAVAFNAWYGSPSLDAAYQVPALSGFTSFVPEVAYRQLFGALLNPTFGLLPFAPILVLGIVGLGCAYRRAPVYTLGGIVGALGYLFLANGFGFANAFSLPARFEIPLAPLLALPMLVLVQRVRARGAAVAVVVAAAVASAALMVDGVRHVQSLYPPVGGGEAVRAPLARDLSAMWPRFWSPAPTTLAQETRSRLVGRLSSRRPLPTSTRFVAESRPADGAGPLSFGVGVALARGGYEAIFTMSRTGSSSVGAGPSFVDVVRPDGTPLGRRDLGPAELPADGVYHTVTVPFRTPGDVEAQPRIFTNGASGLRAGGILLAPTAPGARYPDLLMVGLWIGGMLLAALLLARDCGPRPRPVRAAAAALGRRGAKPPWRSGDGGSK